MIKLPTEEEILANGKEGGLRDGELQMFYEGADWLKNRIQKQVSVEPEVSAENGEDESFEIFDKLLDDCTKGKLFSGEYFWLTSEKRIYKIAKKYLSRVEMRKLEEKYASRFSH